MLQRRELTSPILFSPRYTECVMALKLHVMWLQFGLSASFAAGCLNAWFCFLQVACTDCQTPKNATVVTGSAVWILFLPDTSKTSVFGGDVYGINWPWICIVFSKIRFSTGLCLPKIFPADSDTMEIQTTRSHVSLQCKCCNENLNVIEF